MVAAFLHFFVKWSSCLLTYRTTNRDDSWFFLFTFVMLGTPKWCGQGKPRERKRHFIVITFKLLCIKFNVIIWEISFGRTVCFLTVLCNFKTGGFIVIQFSTSEQDYNKSTPTSCLVFLSAWISCKGWVSWVTAVHPDFSKWMKPQDSRGFR